MSTTNTPEGRQIEILARKVEDLQRAVRRLNRFVADNHLNPTATVDDTVLAMAKSSDAGCVRLVNGELSDR